MSPISLGLDILLIGLLLVALAVGLRLNKRLKTLREGQAHFIAAVGDLDAAALRAEAGLKALRAASEDTHDALLTRIETARALCAKLETVTLEAERARAVAATASLPIARAATPSPPPAAAVPPPRAESRLDPRFRDDRLPPRRPSLVRELDEDLFEMGPDPAPMRRTAGDRR